MPVPEGVLQHPQDGREYVAIRWICMTLPPMLSMLSANGKGSSGWTGNVTAMSSFMTNVPGRNINIKNDYNSNIH